MWTKILIAAALGLAHHFWFFWAYDMPSGESIAFGIVIYWLILIFFGLIDPEKK